MAGNDLDPDVPDAGLVAQARAGDRDAFARLVLRHRPSVLKTCRRLLRDTWEADDVAQEACLQAYIGLDRLADPGSFGAWFHAIAANLARRAMRRNRPAPIDGVGAGETNLVLWSRLEPSPEDASVAREIHQEVVSALAAVSPVNRDAVIRYYIGGYSYGELAELLGVPRSTVRGRLHEGRRQLRRSLVQQAAATVQASRGGPMETTELIAVRVGDFVGRSMRTPERMVLLHEDGGPRQLPLTMTSEEGDAVADAMSEHPPLPPAHDLLLRAIKALGGSVERVVVDRLAQDTYYAHLEVASQRQRQALDARAGDGIALALLAGAPVFVARSVFDQVAWDPEDPEERRRRAALSRAELDERLRSRGSSPELQPARRTLQPEQLDAVEEELARLVSDLGAWSV